MDKNNNISKIKKKPSSRDIIGQTFNEGKLKVVEIIGSKGKNSLYKVICTECSKDTELYPDGYFTIQRNNLLSGCIPCGCSEHTRWKPFQFLVLARRAAKNRFIVHDFAEEFHGQKTKLNLECLVDGYKWSTGINNILRGCGCPMCARQVRPTEQEALQKCVDICKVMDYDVVGFSDGYKGAHKTYFEYICNVHGKQKVKYHNFVYNSTRCSGCSKTGYDPTKPASVYIVKWERYGNAFIKFGITNRKVETRVTRQSLYTEYSYNILWYKSFDDGKIPKIIEDSIKDLNIAIGVVSKEEFPDGYTETTFIDNIDTIKSLIFEHTGDISVLKCSC